MVGHVEVGVAVDVVRGDGARLLEAREDERGVVREVVGVAEDVEPLERRAQRDDARVAAVDDEEGRRGVHALVVERVDDALPGGRVELADAVAARAADRAEHRAVGEVQLGHAVGVAEEEGVAMARHATRLLDRHLARLESMARAWHEHGTSMVRAWYEHGGAGRGIA